jgi:hypothetical protein
LEIYYEIESQFLQFIAINSQFLRKIKFIANYFQSYKILSQKWGQKQDFINIYGIGYIEMASLLRSTHNLKVIQVYSNLNTVNKQYLPKLEEIKL